MPQYNSAQCLRRIAISGHITLNHSCHCTCLEIVDRFPLAFPLFTSRCCNQKAIAFIQPFPAASRPQSCPLLPIPPFRPRYSAHVERLDNFFTSQIPRISPTSKSHPRAYTFRGHAEKLKPPPNQTTVPLRFRDSSKDSCTPLLPLHTGRVYIQITETSQIVTWGASCRRKHFIIILLVTRKRRG